MEKHLLLLSCLAASTYGQSHYGGTAAPVGAYPYQAALKRKSAFVCGASIINHRWLLTAAHCIKPITDPKEATVKVGTNFAKGNDGQEYNVVFMVYHEDYDKGYVHSNDIGLIRLVEDIIFTSRVQPVSLSKDNSYNFEGEIAILSGWGSFGPQNYTPIKLQHVKLLVISRLKCAKEWATLRNRTIGVTQLCTTGAFEENMATHGDSGGPLIVNGVQIGLVSFAWNGLPDIYTRVSSYILWINSYVIF